MGKILERKQFITELGLDPEDSSKWSRKWSTLRSNTGKGRRLGRCLLSFEEYVIKAKEAGITNPEQIHNTGYHLSRYGDAGDYSVDNCRFLPYKENAAEKYINGGIESMKVKKTGRTKDNDPSVARTTEKLTGRTSEGYAYIEAAAEKRSRAYRLISPEGEIIEGKNLTKFCRENDLNQGNMCSVCRGEITSYKGWTGTYVYEEG